MKFSKILCILSFILAITPNYIKAVNPDEVDFPSGETYTIAGTDVWVYSLVGDALKNRDINKLKTVMWQLENSHLGTYADSKEGAKYLKAAIKIGWLEGVDLILSHRINPNVKENSDGKTALETAIRKTALVLDSSSSSQAEKNNSLLVVLRILIAGGRVNDHVCAMELVGTIMAFDRLYKTENKTNAWVDAVSRLPRMRGIILSVNPANVPAKLLELAKKNLKDIERRKH